jgi:hypothetical protein
VNENISVAVNLQLAYGRNIMANNRPSMKWLSGVSMTWRNGGGG